MSATLVAKDLAAGHGDRALFSGLDLVVAPGDVIGLVGANGAGKSTLLRLLAGLDRPEEGDAAAQPAHGDRRPPAAGAASAAPGETVRGLPGPPHRRRRRPDAHWTRRPQALADGAPGADDAYADAPGALARRSAAPTWTSGPRRSPPTSAWPSTCDQPMTALSGGQAARAGLASLLLSRYDVFLLDEPTNDLDLDGLDRLEAFVTGLRAGTVLVSHDREFLARTVTRVVELDLAQQQVSLYGGGYEAYLEEREVARRHAREEYDEYADTARRPRGSGPARSAPGWRRASGTPAARRTDNDKIGRKFRSRGHARSRPPRPGRPSG